MNYCMALYMWNPGSCGPVIANGTTWVTSTEAPAVGKMSIQYCGSAYAIYDKKGTSETLVVNSPKVNATNWRFISRPLSSRHTT